MNENDYPDSDPLHHVAKIHRLLSELADHCREDIGKIDEPKAQVLFETTAETLIGLRTAYEHYATEAEPAMKRGDVLPQRTGVV
jgi:hypothetical protein